jgi:hypothetical protein
MHKVWHMAMPVSSRVYGCRGFEVSHTRAAIITLIIISMETSTRGRAGSGTARANSHTFLEEPFLRRTYDVQVGHGLLCACLFDD